MAATPDSEAFVRRLPETRCSGLCARSTTRNERRARAIDRSVGITLCEKCEHELIERFGGRRDRGDSE